LGFSYKSISYLKFVLQMKKFYVFFFLVGLGFSSVLAQGQKDIDRDNAQAEALLNQNPQQSLETATKTKAAAEAISYRKGVAKATAIMGVANYKIDDYEKAKALIIDAADINELIKDTSELAFCKYWRGNIELNQGHYAKAFDLYQLVTELAQKIGDKKNMARGLDGKASIYESLNEDDKAFEFYNQSLLVAKEAGFKEWYGGEVFALGNLAYKKGHLDTAIIKYDEAIKLSDEVGNINNKASCYQQLASIYYEKKDSKQAMKYIQDAMNLFQQTGSMSSFSYSRLMMSTILLSDGAYDVALNLAKMSLEEGKTTGETQLQKNAAEVLYYAYLGKGDKAKALEYHVLFHKLSEASQNEMLAKKLAKMDMEANFEKERAISQAQAAKHNAEMNAQIDRQRLIKKVSLIGIFMLAIIAGLAIFAFLQKRNDSSIIAAEKKKTDSLLLNILPEEVVNEIKERDYKATDIATVLFADIQVPVGGGEGRPTPAQVQSALELYLKAFDDIMTRHKIERVRTVGDEYLCISNTPIEDTGNAVTVVNAAFEMLRFIEQNKNSTGNPAAALFTASVGIHTGPLIVGIIGIRKFSYVIWGDTVNIAARIEQHGEAGKINVSDSTYRLIQDRFICVAHGHTETKKKEKIDMYFVERPLVQ